ncbi:MAG: transporter [Flavobacterium sp.]|nr:transporter [Flavobacterium sp.]
MAISNRFLSFYLLIYASSWAQFTDVINSNRPGQSMAAFSVGKTIIQSEMGLETGRESYSNKDYKVGNLGGEIVLRYGAIFEQLEFYGSVNYQKETYTELSTNLDHVSSGIQTAQVGAKFMVYDPMMNYEKKINKYSWKANHKFDWHQFIPAVAVYGGLTINNDANFKRPYAVPQKNTTGLKGMLLTQNQFGRFALITNFGVSNYGVANYESIDYVISLTRGINDRWSILLENQGFNSKVYRNTLFRAGGAYLLAENLQVDAAIASSITNEPAQVIANLGFSWRFDANYNEVMLRIPKEKNNGKGGKDNKDKKNKKDDSKAKVRTDGFESGSGKTK